MSITNPAEILDACRVLFGPEVDTSLEFLRYLQPSGLRAAYRRRALETHPDRSMALGENQAGMSDRFIEATTAYETLIPLVQGNGTLRISADPGRDSRKGKSGATQARQSGFSDLYYTRDIPKREMPIGQYLYFSGLISWRTLIEAITWQRRQRPLIGQIALRWRMLSVADVQKVLTEKGFRERFGDRAVRLGYLSHFQLMAILGKQRSLQLPIGKYFVRHGILSRHCVEIMALRHRNHNRNASRRDMRRTSL